MRHVRTPSVGQWLLLVMAVAVSPLEASAADSALPDPARWDAPGIVRVFEQNAGQLLLGIDRRGGSNNGAGTLTINNNMSIANPNNVTRIEATVTVLDGYVTDSGFSTIPRGGLEGFFYWNGTGSGSSTDQTGHVFASTNISLTPSTGQLDARCLVVKQLNSNGSLQTTLLNQSLGPINFFEPHRLSIDYDGSRFACQLDGKPPVTFIAPDQQRLTPRSPFKALRTRVVMPAARSAALGLRMLFDQVMVNGQPFETFDARTLPRVTVMPGSGTFASTQMTDLAVAVETGGLAVSDIKLFFDGTDVSSLLAGLTPGTLAAGGVTRRLKSFPIASLPPGPHVLGVEVSFVGGQVARGVALWNVLPATGP